MGIRTAPCRILPPSFHEQEPIGPRAANLAATMHPLSVRRFLSRGSLLDSSRAVQSMALHVRRTLASLAGDREEEGAMWLEIARGERKAGNLNAAWMAAESAAACRVGGRPRPGH